MEIADRLYEDTVVFIVGFKKMENRSLPKDTIGIEVIQSIQILLKVIT